MQYAAVMDIRCRTLIDFDATPINGESNRYDFGTRQGTSKLSFSISIHITGMSGDEGQHAFDKKARKFDVSIHGTVRYNFQSNTRISSSP